MFYKEFFCNDADMISRVSAELKANSTYTKDSPTDYLLKIDETYGFYNKELYDWLYKCIDELSDSVYTTGTKIVITECWGTHTKKFKRQQKHTHSNSIVSGILYLSDKGGDTEFFLPNPWAWADEIFHCSLHKKVTHKIQPQKGKLILFPSNIPHHTTTNVTSEDRFTLAFNTFFQGPLGEFTSYLNLNVGTIDGNIRQ